MHTRKPQVEVALTTLATLYPTVNFRLVVILIYSFQFRSAFRAASASVTDTSVTDTVLNSSRVFIVVGL